MTTGVADSFGKRIAVNFDLIIESLSSTILLVKAPDFFEFIITFIKKFSSNMTNDNLTKLVQSLTSRILVDIMPPKLTLDLRKGKNTKTKKQSKLPKIRVAKCWSLIRFLAEGASIEQAAILEQCVIPLLQLII